jgi:hypothetical protein
MKTFFVETRGLWVGLAVIVFFPLILVLGAVVVIWDFGDDVIFDWEMAKCKHRI